MRLVRWTVLLLVVLAALPAAGAPPVQRLHRSWSFDGAGTGVLVLQGRVQGPGVLGQVLGDAPGPGRPADVVFAPLLQDVSGLPATTYGRLGEQDLCPAPVTTCRVDADGALLFSTVFVVAGDEESTSAARFHLYLEGTRVSVRDTLVGFRRTPVGGARRVTEQAADGLGARSGGTSAGAHLSAAAPGGRRGSIAVAVPPCGLGAGVARLSGPGVQRLVPCPTAELAAVTRRAGAWRLDGPAAGSTPDSTRLLVLDL